MGVLSIRLVVLLLYTWAVLANPRLFHVIVIGEDDDLDLDPSPDLKAVRSVGGLEEPVLWYNPGDQQLFNMPHSSPVILISHTTDDSFVQHPNETANPDDTFSYKPTPPHHPGWSSGMMFLWGWPEPFPWFNLTYRQPAKTQLEALYPFRHQPLVLLCSCFGRRFEHPAFGNVRGLYSGEYFVEQDPHTDALIPDRRLVATLRGWARHLDSGRPVEAFLQRFDRREFWQDDSEDESEDSHHSLGSEMSASQSDLGSGSDGASDGFTESDDDWQ